MPTTALWALILGGGDGKRLQPLTSRIAGDSRPKQFCPIFEGETLLDRTRRRVDLLVRPDRQVIAVTRTHELYYRRLFKELAPSCLVVQPANRGTGPGILYPLLRIMELAGNVPLAIFPSYHYVSNDRLFMDHVDAEALRADPHRRTRIERPVRRRSTAARQGGRGPGHRARVRADQAHQLLGRGARPGP